LRIIPALLLIGVAIAAPAWAQPLKKPNASGPYVYIIDERNEIVDGPVRNNVIPLWPVRSCFGWTVAVPGTVRSVKILEVQQAPGSTRFEVGPETKVNPQSDRTERRLEAVSYNNQVSSAWCVNDADPPGLYQFDIYVDGRLMGQFMFCAVKFPEGQEIKLDQLQCPNKLNSS